MAYFLFSLLSFLFSFFLGINNVWLAFIIIEVL
uniref:Uncharacterized protein n=1 Tax=Rhizophora mucronata TaxID=61149 RepID=A0A2P2NJZ4_RHIMU